MIFKAIKFIEKHHTGQVRKVSNAPYVIHPIYVSYLIARFKRSKHLDELIVAALLHDTLEDTNATFIEIAQEFSPFVATLVFELTSDENQIKLLGKNEYLKKKLVAMTSYGLVIKLADRLHNVQDNPKPQYIADTIDLINHLKRKRKLTKTHKSIIKEIQSICEGE